MPQRALQGKCFEAAFKAAVLQAVRTDMVEEWAEKVAFPIRRGAARHSRPRAHHVVQPGSAPFSPAQACALVKKGRMKCPHKD